MEANLRPSYLFYRIYKTKDDIASRDFILVGPFSQMESTAGFNAFNNGLVSWFFVCLNLIPGALIP
jgi:hypothetical protein